MTKRENMSKQLQAIENTDLTFEEKKSLLISIMPIRSGGIPFGDLCAAYAALQQRYSRLVIAKTISCSPNALVHLARAPANGRYRKVTDELAHLGRDWFNETYLTPDFLTRMAIAGQKLIYDKRIESISN